MTSFADDNIAKPPTSPPPPVEMRATTSPVADLTSYFGDRATDSLVENLESKMAGTTTEEEASKTVFKGIPENIISAMLKYQNEKEEPEASLSLQDGPSRNSSFPKSGDTLAAVVNYAADEDAPRTTIGTAGTTAPSTASSASPSLPRPRRTRTTTGSSSASNKDAPKCVLNSADQSVERGKVLWATVRNASAAGNGGPLSSTEPKSAAHKREASTDYGSNLAHLANCLMKEQRGTTRPKLESLGTKRYLMSQGDRTHDEAYLDSQEKKLSVKPLFQPASNKEGAAELPPGSNASLLYKNAALLFLRANSLEAKPETSQSNMHEKAQETELRQRATFQRWNHLREALAATKAASNLSVSKHDEESGGPKVIISDAYNNNDQAIPCENEEDDNGFDPNSSSGNKGYRRRPMQRRWQNFKYRVAHIFLFRQDWQKLSFTLQVVGSLAVVLLGIAAILFYGFDNPKTYSKSGGGASFSWWFILTFRWICTLCLAKIIEFFCVNIVVLRSNIALKLFGPFFTLVLVQSKGWPFQLLSWCFCNVVLLRGSNLFVQHWLYWQPYIKMFSEQNSSGDFLANEVYLSVLISGIFVGFLAALKNTVVAVWLGQKTCEYYGPQLEKLMKDLILMSSVANLSQEIEESALANKALFDHHNPDIWKKNAFHYAVKKKLVEEASTKSEESYEFEEEEDLIDQMIDEEVQDKLDSNRNVNGRDVRLAKLEYRLSIKSPTSSCVNQSSGKLKLHRLLDSWEEPTNVGDTNDRPAVSIQDILQFRQIMSHLDVTYPFSKAFGLADNRNSCASSAQEVYNRLLKHTPSESRLPFETLSILALDEFGELSEEETKPLIGLFPPDGERKLSMLDFVKSYDEIYRKFRTFRAAVSNSAVLNNAYERIVDVLFYFLMVLLVLTILRWDVLKTIATVMSLVLSFSFAFGPAVSKFTQGVLLVTLQKPFDIGDRIHISQSTADTAADGSAMWFVENISLFCTTLRFASTNEVATISNGDLSNTKIINGARSINACVCVKVKFGIYTAYDLIQIFKSEVEDFVKARPREWARLNAIRASNVQADLGFIEYMVALQHRDAWQNVSVILTSKAELASFCLELSKKLGMRYVQSPLPVHLELGGNQTVLDAFSGKMDSDIENTQCSSPDVGDKAALLKVSAQSVAGMFKKSPNKK